MKRTKNMSYQASAEARELTLFAQNDGDLYRQRIQPVLANLTRKAQAGKYDADKAVDLWYYVASDAATRYGKQYGGKFTVQERFTAAVDLERDYREEVIG